MCRRQSSMRLLLALVHDGPHGGQRHALSLGIEPSLSFHHPFS